MGDYEHPIRHGVCLKVEPMKYNTKLGEKARDLGLLTGLRRRELGHLKVDDIKFIDCETVHIYSIGKGGSTRPRWAPLLQGNVRSEYILCRFAGNGK